MVGDAPEHDLDPDATEPEDATEPDATEPDATEPDADLQTRRRRWPTVVGVLAVLVVLWLGFVGFRLFTAAADAKRGVDAIDDVREQATGNVTAFIESIGGPDDPDTLAVRAKLETASDAFDSASSAVDSPIMAPLKVVPVVGRQIRSVSALSGSASQVSHATLTAFDHMTEIAEFDSGTPSSRLEAGTKTQDVLAELQTSVSDLDLGPKEGLVGSLAEARDDFAEASVELTDTVDRALTGVTGVNHFLQGPTSYLVLAANNAEMRAGSGMYLQAGQLQVDQGVFVMSDFQPTADLQLPQAGSTLDPDVDALWNWLEPSRDWRNLNATPRFDESARMAADMWAALGNPPVQGVVALDVVGLKRLLQLVGPVEVPNPDGTVTTVSAKNVLNELLLQQYIAAAGNTEQRRDKLAQVGQAVFAALNERGYEPGRLLQAMQRSGRGRHLLVWSSIPVEQAGWEALGLSGDLPGNGLLLGMLNRGGNKLDQFVSVSADMSWTNEGEVRRVSVEISVKNESPDGLPRYVQGPYPGTDAQAGEYVSVIALSVPKTAFDPSVDGGELFLTGEDGPTRLIATKMNVLRGQTGTTTISFDVPASTDEIVVLPSARVPQVSWTADGDSWVDNGRHTVDLDDE